MTTLDLSTVRDTLLSATGSLLVSLLIVAAAVLPAQTATAATAAMFHL